MDRSEIDAIFAFASDPLALAGVSSLIARHYGVSADGKTDGMDDLGRYKAFIRLCAARCYDI